MGENCLDLSDRLTSMFNPLLTKSLILNPFKPEFTIVTFIHYKPRIAVAILDL